MTKFTPNFGWPVAEDADVVKQYPSAVDDPFKTTLDGQLSRLAHAARANGTATGLATGNVVVPHTTIEEIIPGSTQPYYLTNGRITVAYPGVFLLFTQGQVTSSGISIIIRPEGAAQERGFRAQLTGGNTFGVIAALAMPTVYILGPGDTLPPVQVSAAAAGANANVWQLVVCIGRFGV